MTPHDATRRSQPIWASLACSILALSASGCAGDPAEAPSTVLTDSRPAPVNDCPSGGTVVRSGLDANDDGVLGDDEVQASSIVCADAPLVRVEPVATSDDCPEGGTAVHHGMDDDGDGVLDDDEIRSTEIICAGVVLTRVDVEPPGEQCIGGGAAFHTGIDRNRDGVLDDAEIASTEYECSAVLEGSVTIRSEADLARIAGIRVLIGSLIIDDVAVSEIDLPELRAITGRLVIQDTGARTIRMSRLVSIEWGFDLLDNPALSALDLPALRTVSGDLWLARNPELTSLAGLPALQSVGSLVLSENERLASLNGTRLLVEGGRVEVTGCPALAVLELGATTSVSSLSITSNQSLFNLSWLGAVNNDVYIEDNATLARVTLFSSQHTIGGSVVVRGNPWLQRISLSYPAIQGSLLIANNATLQHLWLTQLPRIGGDLLIMDSPVDDLVVYATSTDRGADIGGSLVLENTALTALEIYQVADSLGGGLRIAENPALTRVSLQTVEQLTIPGNITIRDNPALQQVLIPEGSPEELYIWDNPSLEWFWADRLSVTDSIWVRGNALLETFVIQAAAEVGNAVYFTENPTLRSIDLSGLTSLAGTLSIVANGSLQTIEGLEALRYVGTSIRIEDNDSLSSWPRLDALRSVGTLQVEGNDTLSAIELPALQDGPVTVTNNAMLASMSMPAWTSANYARVENNPILPTCAVMALLDQANVQTRTVSGNDDTATCPTAAH